MTTEKTLHVLFIDNADPATRTDELLLDVNRGNLIRGGEHKEITEAEFHSFQAMGAILQVVSADGSQLPESLTKDDLKTALEAAGETVKATDSKETLAGKLEAVQAKNETASQPTGQGSNQTTTTAS